MSLLGENLKSFIPEIMQTARRWGLVQTNKRPALGLGAPEWHADFEKATKLHNVYCKGNNEIHRHVLGYCFGGDSNQNSTKAIDDDHTNNQDGFLCMKPDPHFGCIDYDHVLVKDTRELRNDLSEELVNEIDIITAAYPNEISASGTGLHVIFEKHDDWTEFTKFKDNFPEIKREKEDAVGREVFSGFGYVNFTGNRWKMNHAENDDAYILLCNIVNKHFDSKLSKNT